MPSAVQCHTPGYVPNGREVAVFSTERGLARMRLAGCVSPVNVGNFIELARTGLLCVGSLPRTLRTGTTTAPWPGRGSGARHGRVAVLPLAGSAPWARPAVRRHRRAPPGQASKPPPHPPGILLGSVV